MDGSDQSELPLLSGVAGRPQGEALRCGGVRWSQRATVTAGEGCQLLSPQFMWSVLKDMHTCTCTCVHLQG